MTKFPLIIFAILLVPALLWAQSEKLTLQQAIEIGLKNNFSVLISRNDAEAAKNLNTLGNAGFLPNVSIAASTNNANNKIDQKYSDGSHIIQTGVTSSTIGASGILSWTLFDGLKMFATREKLALLDSSGGLSYRMQIENTISAIVISYSDVFRQKEMLKDFSDLLDLAKERQKITDARFQVGAGSKLDALQAKVDMNAAKTAWMHQELAVRMSKINLNQLLARPVETGFEPEDTLTITYHPTFEELKLGTYKKNTTLLQQQLDRDIANIYLKEVNSYRYPKISFNSSYGYSSAKNQVGQLLLNQNTGINYGFGLTMPLFNGFNLKKQYQNARLASVSAQLRYQESQLQIDAAMLQAWQEYQQDMEILAMEQENIKVARENLSVAMERYRLGSSSALELKDAESSYSEAATRLAGALFTAKSAELALMKLNGVLVK